MKLHHLGEKLGASAITFTKEELAGFRKALNAIPAHGVRTPETVQVDR